MAFSTTWRDRWGANFSMNAVRRFGLETGGTMTVELPAERVLVFARGGRK